MDSKTEISSYLVERFLSDSSLKDKAKDYLNRIPKQQLIEMFLSYAEEKEKRCGIKEEIIIPVSVFKVKSLSSLELVTKYLKENCGKKNKDAAKLLSRSQQVIWTTYSNSLKKFSQKLPVSYSRYDIPISVFSDKKLSMLESVVVYLKDSFRLSYSEIGKQLYRNERTIWTVYNRAKKKQR